ncbi:MAG: type II toxin-antitoxin system RelE/ParE family toxin [Alphaproteobacteria bacterium]|nr:type II toxin-antitoxin system RelE/ParE family toxin [Alphaproteobacteria bacterium]
MSFGRRSSLWSPEALADVDAIWDCYDRVAGRGVANRIVREIEAAALTIEAHPFAGRSRDELRPGYRSIAATPHVMFYRVVGGDAEILRVLDGRRDIEDILADDDLKR